MRKGEIAREMFIIADGHLDVIGNKGKMIARLSTGNFFGEIGILNLDGGINRFVIIYGFRFHFHFFGIMHRCIYHCLFCLWHIMEMCIIWLELSLIQQGKHNFSNIPNFDLEELRM